MNYTMANLDSVGWAVDYIISHCCPTSVQNELSGRLSVSVIKCKKTLRKKCRFVAEEAKKR